MEPTSALDVGSQDLNDELGGSTGWGPLATGLGQWHTATGDMPGRWKLLQTAPPDVGSRVSGVTEWITFSVKSEHTHVVAECDQVIRLTRAVHGKAWSCFVLLV